VTGQSRKFRVLLRGGWVMGVEADAHHSERRAAGIGRAELDVMSFTAEGREVCVVPLGDLVGIADERALWLQPYKVSDGAAQLAAAQASAPARRRKPHANGKTNGRAVTARRSGASRR
jgi:hypothetical protein